MYGERNQNATIYRQYADALTRFASGLVGPSDAQDVVASAVVKVMTSRSWAGVENNQAYLYRAVANEARSQYRSSMRRQAREARQASPDTELPDIQPEVLDAVAGLSTRQRSVVFLTFWEDLDERAVAERLGISAGSVRKHLGRARDKLRGALA